MRLTKYTHACVRLEQDGRVLVIDPGVWAEAEALDGVSDVLLTHEHADHVDIDKLSEVPNLTIYSHPEVAQRFADKAKMTTVEVGQTFTAAGFEVKVVGGQHAETYGGLPGCANVGFIVEGIYHPGDSVFVPDAAIDTLLLPANGPWLKLREALDFVRAVKPSKAFPIHDALLNERGFENFDTWVGYKGNTDYARIPIGGSVTL